MAHFAAVLLHRLCVGFVSAPKGERKGVKGCECEWVEDGSLIAPFDSVVHSLLMRAVVFLEYRESGLAWGSKVDASHDLEIGSEIRSLSR